MAGRMTAPVCFLAALLLAGCQRLNIEQTVALDPGVVKVLKVEAPTRDQKVRIDFSSPGVPVTAWVVLGPNEAVVMEKLKTQMPPEADKLLATSERAESGTLQADIPARTEYAVIVSGARKKTVVTVKITGG